MLTMSTASTFTTTTNTVKVSTLMRRQTPPLQITTMEEATRIHTATTRQANSRRYPLRVTASLYQVLTLQAQQSVPNQESEGLKSILYFILL